MDNNTIAALLKELIMEYSRVSLPCLGSFLSEYYPAVILENIIYPPSRTIVFHQNEIWNDEKLEKRIAEYNNVSIGVAKEQLAFWIDDVCVLLATGEEVVLPQLGRLYVSSESKLMFEQESENLSLDSFGLEPVTVAVNTEELTTIIPPPKKKTKEKTEIKKKGSEKTSNKGLIIGVFIILLLMLVAGFAIFKYILTDKQELPQIDNSINETRPIELKYDEYITPEYGVLISVFDKYNDANAFSDSIGKDTKIYMIDTDKPFAVISADYLSFEKANEALDSLKTDIVYAQSQVVKLESFRIAVP